MKELPDTVTAYKRTPDFDAESVPAGLLRAHSTKAGTWGKIVVLTGTLVYRILEPEAEELQLTEKQAGIIEPEVLHEVAFSDCAPETRFYVELFR